LFQAYDSVYLKSDVELGGTDQKFNILMGRTLQRKMGIAEQSVVLMPLLEGLDGVNKMSKSLGNYIGIDEAPNDMYGKIMSTSDELMLRYYELLSHISLDELNSLKKGLRDGSVHPKKAKENLAAEIVERYWGRGEAVKARQEFEQIFKQKGLPDEIPAKNISPADSWLPQIMKDTGLAKSTSEAIRLIRQGGVKVDEHTVSDQDARLEQGEYILKVGKRRFCKVIVA
jgi:tyrosyl-tRNA synthetase